MAAKGDDRPIIIKRVKKVAAGHHGGSWKVAFADFATAMMAFFLVMWLVGAGTKEQKAAVSEYFQNPSAVEGKSLTPSPGAIGQGGSGKALPKLGTFSPPTGQAMQQAIKPDEDQARKVTAQKERERLEALKEELQKAIAQSQALAPFKDQLLIDITPEGLRIQIVDKLNRPMFDSGSSAMKDYSSTLLHELAPFINDVPNRLSISGHTDETPYSGNARGYTNWELSADRANAARRALVDGGVADAKIARVVGLSSTVPFDRRDPRAPFNRRISIIVMNQHAEDVARQQAAPNVGATEAPAETPKDAPHQGPTQAPALTAPPPRKT